MLCDCLCVVIGFLVQAFVVFCYYMYDNLMLCFFPVRFLLFFFCFSCIFKSLFLLFWRFICCDRDCTACVCSLFVLVSFAFFRLGMVHIIPWFSTFLLYVFTGFRRFHFPF